MKRVWVVLLVALVFLAGIILLRRANTANQSASTKATANYSPAPVAQPSPIPSPVADSSLALDTNSTQTMNAVDNYARKLQAFLDAPNKQSLEPVFIAGQEAQQSIVQDVGDENSILDKQTDTQLEPILKKMRGFVRVGETGQGLLPDWKLFQRFATDKGTPADIAFFTLMLDTESSSGFPTWSTQVTDDTSCTNYGLGKLTKLYGQWHKFQRDFAGAYRDNAENQLRAIIYEFAEGDCVCGDKKSVVKELDLFLKTYPDDPITLDLRKRLDNIQNGKAQLRYKCVPN